MRLFTKYLLTLLLLGIASVMNADPISRALIKSSTVIGTEFTSVADLEGMNFAIINKAEEKALYGSNNQNLAYDRYADAFSSSNSGYLWKLVNLANEADSAVQAYYRLQLITPKGADYNCWGMGGWLNTQPADRDCSFILGLNGQNGQDMKNGAVYDVQYVEGQGFTIKNIGTGLYQGANNGPANNEDPTYFTFATVSNTYVPALEALLAEGAQYEAIITDEAALAEYAAAIGWIDPASVESDGYYECQVVDAAISNLTKALPAIIGQDYTRAIANPSFELGNIYGWVSNNGGIAANNGNFGPATGSFFVERWISAPNKLSDGSLTQVISGMPIGRYKLTAEMQNLEQGNDNADGTGYYLIANVNRSAVTSAGETVSVETVLAAGEDLTIGALIEECTGNWVCVDNFTLTLLKAYTPEYAAAEKALTDAITEAKALDTTGKEGVEALNTAIEAAEEALADADATVESLSAVKTTLAEAVTVFIKTNPILTLNATVGEEVSITFGVWDTEDEFTVDFGGENNKQTAKVGIENRGPVMEDGTTAGATKFTGTVGGEGTIKVYGNNDIWYLVATNGAMPTTFEQSKLMNVVQMSITGADVESVALPAYPKMTQFNFNNSSVKSVDVTKVTSLTSLTINNTTASKYAPQLESIDLSRNTELTYLSLQGNTNIHGKLKTLDLSANTKLDKMYIQYNQLESVTLPAEAALSFINLQDNNLESLDMTSVSEFKDIYLSNNKLAEIDLSKIKSGATVNIEGNALTTLTIPVSIKTLNVKNNQLASVSLTNAVTQCNLEGNKLTLATIPAQPASMNTASKTKKFTYAPQAALEVAETVSELDLTSQLTVAQGELNPEAVGESASYSTWLENQTTTFAFVTSNGYTLDEGIDYEEIEPGKFLFLKAQEEKVHAVMQNAAFPKFTETVPFVTTEFTVEAVSEPLFADGTYYIYNNGAGKYLGAGAEWSTHAIVDNVGLDYYLSYNVGKYTIDSRVSNGGNMQYLNGEWNDANMFGWTFVDKGNGNYMISDGNQFLAAQEDGRVVMTNDTTLSYLWTLKTLEQRLAEFANATPENPVDATFLIQGANFNRNDQRNGAWSLNASNRTLSGGNNVNNCAESYHSAFTLAQTLYNAPAGKYLVSAQGFYRQDGDMTEELPVFYANNSTAAFPVKDGAENSMSDASESFSVGLYNIEPFVVNVSEAGALTIGARGTALSQWVIFDNFRLTYLSSEVDVDDIAADYAQVLADAKATLESEHYVMVIGIERESLAETIEAYSAVENEQYAYMDAINHLSYATSYFTNAKDAYERLIKAKEQLANCVEDYSYANPRYKEEASEYAELTAQMADDASIMADWVISQARRIAESHALLEGVENSANMTGYISNADAYFGRDYWELVLNSGGYIDIRGDQPLTSADYGTYSYFDGGNWSSDYWDVALQQEIYLPAGRYQLTVSSRASSDVAFTLFAGDASVAMPTIGSEGGLFGNGWNDTSLEFDMPKEGYVTIGVRGESNVIHNWMSFTRFRLAKFPNAADYNKLYIAEDTKLLKGNATLPISLQNEDEIVGLQFDVVLPYSDMELTGLESGFRSESHGFSFNQMGDGSYRVVMASMDNEVIEGNDGVLLNLGIKVPAYMQMGWYGITLKNVVMTTKSLQTIKCSDRTFYVNISGRMGDVNSDDVIDVTDVVLIIDNILEHYNANFNEAMADVNSDGYIDVTDVVNVIDAILGRIELSRGAELVDRSAYTAFQMDLTIPAGYVLESVTLTDIAKDSHSLAYTMLPDGRCRVVVCSMNNEALPGAWDEVISLNLRGKGDAQVNIDRAVFVTIDGERHELMLNPTSIAQLSNLNSQISTRYDLQGRKMEKASKGILIENGKKVVIK